MILFEVRMPACERPALFERAVRSLQAQTYVNWRAVVYDDSRSNVIRDAASRVADDRISYVRNVPGLGAAYNIDRCFTEEPLLGGQYACILEDDNFWLPRYLELLADAAANFSGDIILANQRINHEGVGLRDPSETTRGEWFENGLVQPMLLRASLLLMEGLSNGGLVWKLNSGSTLRVGQAVRETSLHEACRSLLIREPFLFIADALAVWTLLPREETARAREGNRVVNRGMQAVRDFVLRAHGPKIISLARLLANTLERRRRLIQSLAYNGYLVAEGFKSAEVCSLMLKSFIKGLALRATEANPCETFLNSGKPAILSHDYSTS